MLKRGIMKQFALVLGGGAAKGYAHIGFIKVLEENGLKPNLIVGTSMGALVGGVYSLGRTAKQMQELAEKVNGIGTFSLYSTLFKDNLLNISKIKKILANEFGETTHEQTPIKFVSVATELNTGKEKHFDSGRVYDSVMASIAMPAVFPRVKMGENYYCDGGLLNNLPEDVAREILPNGVIISVDVIGEYEKNVEKIKLKTLETILNASTLMTSNVVKSKPVYADLRITITQPNISQLDFSAKSANKSIRKGVNIGHHFIKEIKQLLE